MEEEGLGGGARLVTSDLYFDETDFISVIDDKSINGWNSEYNSYTIILIVTWTQC